MNYDIFCQSFYSVHHIPVAFTQADHIIHNYGLTSDVSPFTTIRTSIKESLNFPVVISKETGFYGIIKLKSEPNSYLLIGPVFATHVTRKVLHEYMVENTIASTNHDEVQLKLSIIPQYTYYQFINLIIFLEYILNQKEIDPTIHFNISSLSYQNSIASQQMQQSYQNREEHIVHGTYELEQQILEYIKSGNTIALEDFLLNTFKKSAINEGIVGNTPLRQAKNLFIASVALVGKTAAIPGGLDTELVYHLIDIYSRECEQMQSIETVTNLHFSMLIDFANRVEQSKLPTGISHEVFSCIQYINRHLNEALSIKDVAAHIKRSPSYTIEHFKKELGFNIGAYITHARIQEAKSLLRYTDKSLSEISNYLCFSSQSYFQNVFKKITGQTPLSYRKEP